MRMTLILTLVLATSCTISSTTQTPKQAVKSADYSGAWSGKTSQEHPIRLTVDNVDGRQVVTGVMFNIKVSSQSYSMTETMYAPKKIAAVIRNQQFRVEWKQTDTSYVVSGSFVNATLVKGSITTTYVHSQGYGTAIGEATFTASREAAKK